MKSASRAARLMFAIGVVGAFATAANAQPSDKRTTYTFSNSVELPGMTLPAGEYIFRLADPDSGRQVLQVLSGDQKKTFGMFFSMPIQAAEAPDKPQVRFMEATPGQPVPIRAVWYTGERTGREFIYPRAQAMKIAKAAKEPVLTTAANTSSADATKSGDLSRISSSGQDTRVADSAAAQPPVTASNQAGGTANTSRPAPPARSSLPQTASSRSLLGLVGVSLLVLAAAIRSRRASMQ